MGCSGGKGGGADNRGGVDKGGSGGDDTCGGERREKGGNGYEDEEFDGGIRSGGNLRESMTTIKEIRQVVGIKMSVDR